MAVTLVIAETMMLQAKGEWATLAAASARALISRSVVNMA
jgi:hypothetical protein